MRTGKRCSCYSSYRKIQKGILALVVFTELFPINFQLVLQRRMKDNSQPMHFSMAKSTLWQFKALAYEYQCVYLDEFCFGLKVRSLKKRVL